MSGPSVSDLVNAKSPEADARLREALDASYARFTAIVKRAEGGEAYDQMIGEGNDDGNAVVEAAHQIIRLLELEDQATGSTVGPNVITGGRTSNTVPDLAEIRAQAVEGEPEQETGAGGKENPPQGRE